MPNHRFLLTIAGALFFLGLLLAIPVFVIKWIFNRGE